MTAFYPVLNTPTTAYGVQPGGGFLDPGYLKSEGTPHNALDLNAVTGGDTDLGDPIHAADDGEVTSTGYDSYIGGMVEVRHADGTTSGYWHLRDIHVKPGMQVRGGDMIGQMGKGGPRSGGKMKAHLHFYVKKAGVRLPLAYWHGTQEKDPAKCADFIRANYHHPGEWLAARGAARTLGELQAIRATRPPLKVMVNTGQGAWVDAVGKTITISGAAEVVINTTDPNKIQIRYLGRK